MILTYTHISSPEAEGSSSAGLQEYLQAQRLGVASTRHGACAEAYPACAFSVLDYFGKDDAAKRDKEEL